MTKHRGQGLQPVSRFRVPTYLASWRDIVGLVLACVLLVMFALEPILYSSLGFPPGMRRFSFGCMDDGSARIVEHRAVG